MKQYILVYMSLYEINKIKATKTSTPSVGRLGTGTKHRLFTGLTKNSTMAKHRMFSFALCTCLVPVKLNYVNKKCCHFWCKVFQHFLAVPSHVT